MLSVFDKCDIFCIQETWFAVQDLHVVNSLHSKFHGFGVSTTDYKDGLVSGHPPDGIAIFGASILISRPLYQAYIIKNVTGVLSLNSIRDRILL